MSDTPREQPTRTQLEEWRRTLDTISGGYSQGMRRAALAALDALEALVK